MNASVSAILAESHGITAQPGAKGECLFCHHKTFSIKRDDLLGKCFHPAYGRFITPSQRDGKSPQNLTNVLEAIYHGFHQELLAPKDVPYRNAYSYLVAERQIHPCASIRVATPVHVGVSHGTKRPPASLSKRRAPLFTALRARPPPLAPVDRASHHASAAKRASPAWLGSPLL
jgi:hypothetical protein